MIQLKDVINHYNLSIVSGGDNDTVDNRQIKQIVRIDHRVHAAVRDTAHSNNGNRSQNSHSDGHSDIHNDVPGHRIKKVQWTDYRGSEDSHDGNSRSSHNSDGSAGGDSRGTSGCGNGIDSTLHDGVNKSVRNAPPPAASKIKNKTANNNNSSSNDNNDDSDSDGVSDNEASTAPRIIFRSRHPEQSQHTHARNTGEANSRNKAANSQGKVFEKIKEKNGSSVTSDVKDMKKLVASNSYSYTTSSAASTSSNFSNDTDDRNNDNNSNNNENSYNNYNNNNNGSSESGGGSGGSTGTIRFSEKLLEQQQLRAAQERQQDMEDQQEEDRRERQQHDEHGQVTRTLMHMSYSEQQVIQC